jgi:hypothetical protein
MRVYEVKPTAETLNAELSIRLKEAQRSETQSWAEAARYRELLRQCCEAATKEGCRSVLDIAAPVVNEVFKNGQISEGGTSFLESFDRTTSQLACALKSLQEIKALAQTLKEEDIKVQILASIESAQHSIHSHL